MERHRDPYRAGHGPMYLQYLDGQFKKTEDAQVKAGLEKSYKILRTMDDGGEWNLLILREFRVSQHSRPTKRSPTR